MSKSKNKKQKEKYENDRCRDTFLRKIVEIQRKQRSVRQKDGE